MTAAVIYSSTKVKDNKGLQAFNASFFPCHPEDTKTIYLNGNFPVIEELCKTANIECKLFSEYSKPKITKEPK